MTDNQITVAMERFGNCISPDKRALLREKLQNAEDSCMDGLMNLPMKNKWIAFVLSFLFGGVGAGRFYLGDYGIAIAHIVVSVLTAALSFVPILGLIVEIISAIRLIVDWFMCYKKAQNNNYVTLCNYLVPNAKKANDNENGKEGC